MSKTTQEKKAKLAKEQTKVEVLSNVEERNATVETHQDASIVPESVETTAEETTTKIKTAKVRGKKYKAAKAKIDVTKYYTIKEAVSLVKSTSFSKFDGKIEAHITTFDIGNIGDISFPHMEAASKNIVVLNDAVLAEIKEGKINFDILIATPATMPKLLPFARTLGPKGLMPNPKNGTLTDKPEAAVKKLSVAKIVIKTEKKAPVVHTLVGKVSQSVDEIAANIEELIKLVKPTKIKKFAICATMGPAVKIAINK